MKPCEIIDFSNAKLSDRAGTYGGQAGLKDGIIYNDEYWIIKYPKSTSGMDVKEMSYTTSPLSEYIGSHIYEILGIEVHETKLGYRNNKIVVACKDFCKNEGSLREIRTIKNLANPFLAEILERDFSSTGSEHFVNLEELLLHMEYNDILSKVKGIKERFWNCVVIDALINNNDRNNGNWGVLRVDGEYRLAPVFDNGAAFSNKTNDNKLAFHLESNEKLKNSALNTISSYGSNEKAYTVRKLFEKGYEDLYKAVIRLTPVIKERFNQIEEMINAIPNKYEGLEVCSEVRKKYYISSMKCRLDYIIVPTYEKIIGKSTEKMDYFNDLER